MVFCTIITSDYIHYALALRESLLQFQESVQLYILVSDVEAGLKEKVQTDYPQTYVIYPDEVCSGGLGKAIYEKYAHTYTDGFRWSMKPVFMKYILEKHHKNSIIYLDCDIQFFSDYAFLWNLFADYKCILSPHNRSLSAQNDSFNFKMNFTEGIYNGGFFGARKDALDVLDWWAEACLFECRVDKENGMYVDQKYLDILPARFEKVYSIKHLGCNVADWNISECKRVKVKEVVKINGVYEIVFIHFSNGELVNILNGNDKLLLPYFTIYAERLQKYGNGYYLGSFIKDKYLNASNYSFDRGLNKVESGKLKSYFRKKTINGLTRVINYLNK